MININAPIIRVLITGANGFLGKNLIIRLKEYKFFKTSVFLRTDEISKLKVLIQHNDVIVHLAGENRPKNVKSFRKNNYELTKFICDEINKNFKKTKRKVKIIFASSTQANQDNDYGNSKLLAEKCVQALSNKNNIPVTIYRFPGIFGKWCKPNYNSVVATFCYNVARGLPVKVNDPKFELNIVYIDDVVNELLNDIQSKNHNFCWGKVEPEYTITLGNLLKQVKSFQKSRENLITQSVGKGLTRCLYSTYLSYLPNNLFSYKILEKKDERGKFVEILKTQKNGQISFFTAHPGITRGEHYHHTKTEKFLVIKGKAKFKFRHIITNEIFEYYSDSKIPEIIDTIPGWAHNITNVGEDEMLVLLWANEIFDPKNPDTIYNKV